MRYNVHEIEISKNVQKESWYLDINRKCYDILFRTLAIWRRKSSFRHSSQILAVRLDGRSNLRR